jgi:SAM-dependent methyltransferase
MIDLPVRDMADFGRWCGERGPLSPEENERVFRQIYAAGPRRALRRPLIKYGLEKLRVLDVGCDYGQALIHFGPGSMGLEVHAAAAAFGRTIGLPIVPGDLFDEAVFGRFPAGGFDAAWVYAVLEHLSAPHTALMLIRSRLTDGGLLLVGLPLMPICRVFEPGARFLNRLVHGRAAPMSYTSADHVGAFTPKTIRFMLERAGFEVIEQAAFVSARPWVNRAYNLLAGPARDAIVTIGRKRAGWDYPPGATRRLTAAGWEFRTDYTDRPGSD